MIDAGTHGAVNWVDLSTPDIAAATAFYREVLGWSIAEMSTPMGDYYIGKVGAAEVAGMMQQGPELAGDPAVWTTFVFVDGLDATLETIESAEGTVLTPPLEIPGDARVAVIADPTGAMLALIEGPEPEDAYFSKEPGAVVWVELLTRDLARAEDFYRTVFGWKATTSLTGETAYTTFHVDGEDVAGMMAMPAAVLPEAPAHWAVYFSVADCREVERRCVAHGGEVLHPTTEIASGTFAVLADPHGATFHIMGLTG
jgi:predicted enzyme related to lactoylglutathione lyase